MRLFFYTCLLFICLALGTALGGASAWWALDHNLFVQQISRGAWVARPHFGQSTANPYTLAKSVQSPRLHLGPGEGIEFVAKKDDAGNLLMSNCNYFVHGNLPQSRLWTLWAADENGLAIFDQDAPLEFMHSLKMARFEGQDLQIHIGPEVRAGNWFSITRQQAAPIHFVIRLYDTSLNSSASLTDLVMPKVELDKCKS